MAREGQRPRACAAGRCDEFASAKPDFGFGGAVVSGPSATLIVDRPRPHHSCRHMIEGAIR
jgi:hypothetical protein